MPHHPPHSDVTQPEWMRPAGWPDRMQFVIEMFAHRGWIGLPVLLLSIITGFIGCIYEHDVYVAKSIIQIYPQPNESIEDLLVRETATLEGDSVVGAIVKKYQSESERKGVDVPKLSIQSSPPDPVLILTAQSTTGEKAAEFLNEVGRIYLHQIESGNRTESEDILKLREELQRIQNQEKQSRNALEQLENENDLKGLKAQIAFAPSTIKALQKRLELVRINLEAINLKGHQSTILDSTPETSLEPAKKLLQPPRIVPIRSDDDPKEELKMQKAERDILSTILSSASPEISKLNEEIHEKEIILSNAEHAADLIDPLRDPLFKEELAIQKNITDLETRLKSAIQITGQYESLKESIERNTELHSTLSRQYDQLGGKEFKRAEIKQQPVILSETIKPNRVGYLAMASLVGIVLALALISGLEFADDRLRSAREFYRKSGQNILGVVPMVDRRKSNAGPLLYPDLPNDHPFSQSFRKIRDQLIASSIGKSLKTILVTSSVPADGKSTNSVNLAIAFSEKGKTILLDSDLRRMNVHRYFKLDNGPGVLDILSGRCKNEECIQHTSMPNLDLLRAGSIPEHPGEMFLANKFKSLLESLSKDYDFILVDSAPVMVADDTLSLAPNSDGVIFIVRANQTPYRIIHRALAFLTQRRARLLGVIFNSSKATV